MCTTTNKRCKRKKKTDLTDSRVGKNEKAIPMLVDEHKKHEEKIKLYFDSASTVD